MLVKKHKRNFMNKQNVLKEYKEVKIKCSMNCFKEVIIKKYYQTK